VTTPDQLAVVCPYDLAVPGGVQGQVVMLARELARRGRRVWVLSPGASTIELDDAGVIHRSVGASRSVAANGSAAPLSFHIGAARRAAQELEAAGVAVAHLHEPLAPVAGWPLLRRRRMGLVGTFHRAGVDRTYAVAGRALRGLVRRLDACVAVSPAAATTATAVAGTRPVVLFNGIDVDAYADAAPWPTESPTCLFLGRDEPRKGREVLVAAAAHLDPEVAVWVTGAPPADFQVGSGAAITFLGRIGEDEKRRRLAAASVLVAPALGGESFGMVLLEGLAAGATVVASDIDGYRQALGGAGILVPPGDPTALAAGISRALLQPRGPRPAPRATAFSVASLVDHYEPLYERAAAAARRRR
jgi:phosphatidylinositol alpha-mannosyltransferase